MPGIELSRSNPDQGNTTRRTRNRARPGEKRLWNAGRPGPDMDRKKATVGTSLPQQTYALVYHTIIYPRRCSHSPRRQAPEERQNGRYRLSAARRIPATRTSWCMAAERREWLQTLSVSCNLGQNPCQSNPGWRMRSTNVILSRMPGTFPRTD